MAVTLLDAGIVIGVLDSTDAHHLNAVTALTDARNRRHRIVLPASAFAEALVGPHRRGAGAVAVVRQLVDRLPIEVVPIDEEVADDAALLRAKHRSLKLPDALVIATADRVEAEQILTTDRGWPSHAKLGIRARITVV